MNNTRHTNLNLMPYPVDMNGNREYVEVIPAVPTTQFIFPAYAPEENNCSGDTQLDAREANASAFTLLKLNEEGYKTPTTLDTTYTQCPKRKSSKPDILHIQLHIQ